MTNGRSVYRIQVHLLHRFWTTN